MNDLISRAAAKRAINDYKNSMIGLAPLEINRIVDLLEIILKLSAMDAVPVVRCENCKHRWDSINCPMYSEGMETPDGWFCADGKRRESE